MVDNSAQNSTTGETPMGRVWFIVLLSMCFTLAASWIWHTNGVNNQLRRNKIESDIVIANTAKITPYRDVLKEKGKEAAIEYLAGQSKGSTYGN